MSIDTNNKRLSIFNIGFPILRALPEPDGEINGDDRSILLKLSADVPIGVTYAGTSSATIPMLTASASGTYKPHSFSPLIRRVSVQRTDFRRRASANVDLVRRTANQHADELKPPR